MQQLELFSKLPIPRGACPWKRWRGLRRPVSASLAEQLAFTFRLRALICDRDTEFDFPQHTVIRAADATALDSASPRSVFDLAARPIEIQLGRNDVQQQRTVAKVVVDGVTRAVGAAYPVRGTPEDEERERARRARQRPPRPTRKARTMSRKLADLIMGDDDGE